MRKLYPRRHDLGDATFSRSSSAYGLDGKMAITNVPRIERTEFGKVVWIEEATTNLVPVANQKFVGWNAYGGASVILTQNQAVPEWGATDATRIQTNGGTHILKYYIFLQSPSVDGQAYVTSLHIKNIGNHPVVIHTNLSSTSPQTVDVGETTLVKIAGAGNGVNVFQIQIRALDAAHALDFIAWQPMAEAKEYATSFIETSRAAEYLTMPIAGLSPSVGTIEGIVEINDLIKNDSNGARRVFSMFRQSGYAIHLRYYNGYWELRVWDGANTYSASIPDSLIPNGWYFYKTYWTGTSMTIEFWNLSTRKKVASSTNTNVVMPTSSLTGFYLGCVPDKNLFANTRFGRHRLSNIARTTDPDFNNLMPRDEYTVALFDPTYTFL